MFRVKILADSVNPQGNRITTCELTYPRCVHAEHLRHRMFSYSVASSRAIPIEKMLQQVEETPFIPIHWGKAQKGMQAYEELAHWDKTQAEWEWLVARSNAVKTVMNLNSLGLHKQIANRLLEPWMWITVICTGNSVAYENFFHLRCSEHAEPHIQKLAYMLRDEYDVSNPSELEYSEVHLPLIYQEDRNNYDIDELMKISVGRCARVSYLTHDGKRDPQKDIELHDRLKENCHWSPFEHIATVDTVYVPRFNGKSLVSNLGKGWLQYRKEFQGECCEKSKR